MTKHTPEIAALTEYARMEAEHSERIVAACKVDPHDVLAWKLAWSIVDAHKPRLDAAHRAAFIDTEAL